MKVHFNHPLLCFHCFTLFGVLNNLDSEYFSTAFLFNPTYILSLFNSSGDDPRNHVFFKGINFHRLEAGLVEPPWVPKPNVIYAKNVDTFKYTSEVEDVKFDSKDELFFKEFSTGAVPIRWQNEMIESGVFDQLNNSELNSFCHKPMCLSRMCIII